MTICPFSVLLSYWPCHLQL